MTKRIVRASIVLGLAMTGGFVNWSGAQGTQEAVSFTKDIQPILQNSCWKCHGKAMQLSKLDLSTREAALKGGEKGAAIVPGNSSESRFYRRVAGLEKPAMPMDGTLAVEQVAAIKTWIDQGAHWDAGVEATAPAVDRKSVV